MVTNGASPTISHTCPPGLESEVLSVEQAQLLAETFQVLGDPTRVRIVHALQLHELCTSDLASVVGMSESAVSHQLRTLRQMQVVRTRRDGKLVYYSLHDEHVRRMFTQSLEHVFEKAEQA
jgi:ArsR family transcriptional regulator